MSNTAMGQDNNNDFQQLQFAFAKAIRNPLNAVPAGVETSRMAVYQELFFNNVQNFVSSAFPVLRSLYTDALWQQKLRLFFGSAKLESPYFLDISACFFQWFSAQGLAPSDPVFALELAHYEWLELYLATSSTEDASPPVDNITEQLQLQLSELALVLCYQYPVMQISRDFQPAAIEAPCYLLLYRDAADEVKFVSLNQLSASALQILVQNPGITLAEVVAQLQLLTPKAVLTELQHGAAVLFGEFARKGVIRAFQAPQNSLP